MNLVNEGVLPPDELDDRDERREEQERARSRETVADIVAVIRKCAQRWEKLCEGVKDSNLREALKPQTETYSILADRLEAAWKRDEERAVEHATRHAEAVARDNCRDCVHNPSGKNFEGGNAAAMREALVQCELFLGNVSRHGHPTLNPGDKCTACDGVDELRGMVVRAISAPPRNCDKMPDIDNLTMHDLAKSPCKSTLECASREELLALVRWLLAPAAERKETAMEASEEDDFYCPLCGCNLLWMPVSRIFVCEHCKESFSESAKYYLRKKEDVTEGNQQKMREALVFLRDQELWMLEGNVRHCVGLTVFGLEQVCKIMRGVIEDALSAPPRQCDVGTPEEQTRRMFSEFCCQYECYELPSGKHCPLYHEGIDCRFTWAQMPYKAEEGGAQ